MLLFNKVPLTALSYFNEKKVFKHAVQLLIQFLTYLYMCKYIVGQKFKFRDTHYDEIRLP